MTRRRSTVKAVAVCAALGALTLQPPSQAVPEGAGDDNNVDFADPQAGAPAGTVLRVGTALHRFVPGRDNQGMIVREDGESHVPTTTYRGPRGRYTIWVDHVCDFVGETVNYFSFDLRDVEPGSAVHATLVLRRGGTVGQGVTVAFSPLSVDARALNTHELDPELVFDEVKGHPATSEDELDLTGGGDPDDLVRLELSASTVAAINEAAGGFFTIAGNIQRLGPGPFCMRRAVFAGTGSNGIQRLVIETAPSGTVPAGTDEATRNTGATH